MHTFSYKFVAGLAFALAVAVIGFFGGMPHDAKAQQTNIQITGSFDVGSISLVRFVDAENNVICYMNTFNGALSCVK